MQVSVVGAELFATRCQTRMPFRFGSVTMTEATLLSLRVRVDGDVRAIGHAADLLVPRWFDKTPGLGPDEDRAALVASARAALAVLRRQPPRSPFDLWRHTYTEVMAATDELAPRRLLLGFGVALAERAVIDAACRGAGLGFAAALQRGVLGFDPACLHPDTAGWTPPDAPADTIGVRHTVGMGDPLTEADCAGHRVDDGFPECLRQDVQAYGLRAFKLKIGAGPQADGERLTRIAEVLDGAVADGGWTCTVDGNEQYGDLDALLQLFAVLRAREPGRRLLARLRYVEQPLPRHLSFDPAIATGLARVSATAPVILDEADVDLAAFPRALALGYRGVSVKACKGVFRALANAALAAARPGAFQSGEDLTNLPTLPLQQDLALMSTLRLPDVERNGHHYFRGLDHLPKPTAAAAAARHPDLYRPTGPSPGHALRIEDGTLRVASLHTVAGLGHDVADHLPALGEPI